MLSAIIYVPGASLNSFAEPLEVQLSISLVPVESYIVKSASASAAPVSAFTLLILTDFFAASTITISALSPFVETSRPFIVTTLSLIENLISVDTT